MKDTRLLSIDLENVSYIRAGNPLLNEIDWKVKSQSNWVLFGPNGAGKTTLLKIITGYIHATRGKVSVLGQIFGQTNLPELRKKIGWMSTSLESLIHNSDPVLEIVLAGYTASTRLWTRCSEKQIAKAIKLLEDFKCGEILNQKYGLLSQGEQKKVLIARSLINDPPLLILDEPCAGLDIAAREELLLRIQDYSAKKNAPTMIFVTHHVEEILPTFSNILCLKSGTGFYSGKINGFLTTRTLSKLFEIPIVIRKNQGRYFSMAR